MSSHNFNPGEGDSPLESFCLFLSVLLMPFLVVVALRVL
jgi:hypothetical protein